MCGIAGIVFSEKKEDKAIIMKPMMDAIKHRGPDGDGYYEFDTCILGHVRLSIVDLEGGVQPMVNRDSTSCITFNGEIYGYNTLKGNYHYPYQNDSDTELILAMYQEHGFKLPESLPGMFSLAIWDQNTQSLFCARDRFGEKPFYYARGKEGEFVFSSEIKGILASGLIKPKISQAALANFLKKGYVNPMCTIYENIHVLPPAHALTFSNGDIKMWRYWSPNIAQVNLSYTDAIDQFRHLLLQSIQKQLIADVPVAAFLSGGLDSSTVVALAARINKDVKAISFEFEDDSEMKYARELSTKYGIELIEVNSTDVDFGKEFLNISKYLDEPFADSSIVPTYIICKKAKEFTKVALTGDGADELLGGYSYWYSNLLKIKEGKDGDINWKEWFKMFLIKNVSFLNITSPQNLAHYNFLNKSIKSQSGFDKIHNDQNTYFSNRDIEALLGIQPSYARAKDVNFSNSPSDGLLLDTIEYMPGDILVKSDRASMANGLELRAPFLDQQFAEFCLSLPLSFKIDSTQNKKILRDAMEDYWPVSIRNRPKQGFSIDLNKWMQMPEIQQIRSEIDNDGNSLSEIIDIDRLKSLSLDANSEWDLLSLAAWKRNKI